jgi:hypothetical protein
MVYSTQNYCFFFLPFPSSGVLRVETRRFGNWICFRPQVKGGVEKTATQLGPLERAISITGQLLSDLQSCSITGVAQ